MRGYLTAALLACAACSSVQPREPRIISRSEYIEIDQKMKPHVAQAKKTLPSAKARFVQGLPEGDKLYLTVRLRDPDDRFEQVLVLVDDWVGDKVLGRVASRLFVVQSYRQGDLIDFPEHDALDWTIVKADGSKEGDYVGTYLRGCGAEILE